jgi:hypothetical protein
MSSYRYFILALSILTVAPAFSQINSVFIKKPLTSVFSINKSTAICGNDTLEYPLSKATEVEWQRTNMNLGAGGAGGYAQIAQRYEAPQLITVRGACFYAKTNTTSTGGPASFDVQMYSTDSVGLPDTMMTTISTSAPLMPASPYENTRMCVSFPTAVATSNDYFIVIDGRGTTLPLSLARNSFAFDNGQSEGLGVVYYDDGLGGANVKWYDQRFDSLFISPSRPLGWNYDYLLDPIVSYDLESNTIISGLNYSCSSVTKCVESDSIPPIFNHRMYSTNPTASRLINWGDGNSTASDSACHDYSVPGLYYISQSIIMNGWNISCASEELDSIYIDFTPTANFSISTSEDTVEFTNTSSIDSGTISYIWDFGSAGSSTAIDVTVVFPTNGSYDVQLIATSDNGCSDTITQTVFITVGLGEEKELQLSMYPNPSNGLLVIDNTQNENVNISIMEMTGELIHSDLVEMGQHTININHLASGHYLVKFSNKNAVRVEKLLIVK